MGEQADGRLDPQDSPARVLDPGVRNDSRLDGVIHRAYEPLVLEWNHDHVETGVYRQADRTLEAWVELAHAEPVGDEESAKAKLALEHIRQQVAMRVQLQTVPAAVRDHDAQRAGRDDVFVWAQVNASQRRLFAAQFALVQLPPVRASRFPPSLSPP